MSGYLGSLRIGQKLFIVGGVPILIAGIIAASAWTLIVQAERSSNGAIVASETHQTFTSLNKVRDDYIADIAAQRPITRDKFDALSARAADQLGDLKRLARTSGQSQAIATVEQTLHVLLARMTELVSLEGELTEQIKGLSLRASSLIDITDFARKRQQSDNAELIAVLKRKEAELERNQAVVTALGAFRDAISTVEVSKARIGHPVFQIEFDELESDLRQLDASSARLSSALLADGQKEGARYLAGLTKSYWEKSRNSGASQLPTSEGFELIKTTQPSHALVEWSNALTGRTVAEQDGLHRELADLIKGSVLSNEGELVAQNIALATLKLAQQTGAALAHRNAGEAKALLNESGDLAERARTLPVLPSIKVQMSEAIDGWRAQLSTTIGKVEEQNGLVRVMDRLAASMGQDAQALSKVFVDDSARLATFIRRILVLGTVIALLLGIAAAVAVAGSITRPLHTLQRNMLHATDNFAIAHLDDEVRRDELGDIARATNVFLAEIGRQARGWRFAARQADEALVTLRQAQDDLVRSEKLASLGQLVAGVSHEISTPLGIALTTATQMQAESASFDRYVNSDQISRAKLKSQSVRLGDGVGILSTNLMRAADLLNSFKQVAVDQAREDRRVIELDVWLNELLKSLATLIRSGKHELIVAVPPDIKLDTYPGILAQVVSNLIKNAIDHGLRDRTGGSIAISASLASRHEVCLSVRDNGCGIGPSHLKRVFDPFFTTARARGGTGLGLHIVHNLVVNKLEGRVDLKSVLGVGTTFQICLPLALGASPELAEARSA